MHFRNEQRCDRPFYDVSADGDESAIVLVELEIAIALFAMSVLVG
ncbi:hypothetical protein [Argonema galeatum]|nr:hypothetical protein [Argonema galeatum]